MKFFFAILPFILGATSCSDSAVTKSASTGAVVQPRTVGEFVRAGVRYLEPVYANHVTPYDGNHGSAHYRPYYGPPVYGRQQFVEVSPAYGPYEPYGYGYPYPYPGQQGPYYRPYSPVVYREVVPVNVPGEHVPKGHHFEAVVGPKHHPHHHVANVVSAHPHFGQPRQPHYVEDSPANKKTDEVGVVGTGEHVVTPDAVYRSTGPIVPSETVQPSGVVVPIAVVPTGEDEVVESELEEKSIRKNGGVGGLGGNRKQNRFPYPGKGNGKNRPGNKLSEAEVQNSGSEGVASNDVPQVVVAQGSPVTVFGVVPSGVEGTNQASPVSGGANTGSASVPSVSDVNANPVVAVPVGMMPAVPVASQVMVSNEPNTQQPASTATASGPVKQA